MKFKPSYTSTLPSTPFLDAVNKEPFSSWDDPAATSIPFFNAIPNEIRNLGCYIAGNPGFGKSSIIQYMALEDIRAGRGTCVIDPTGDLVKSLIEWIPEDRVADTIVFDTRNPVPIDLFSYRNPDERQVLTDQLLDIFELDNAPISKPRLQRILGTLFDANENPEMRKEENIHYRCTFLDIQRFIEDKKRFGEILKFAPEREKQWAVPIKPADYSSITERMTPFTESPTLRTMLECKSPRLNIWDVMQQNKILLVSLRETKTDRFIGSLIASKFQQATFGRDSIKENERTPYALYVDECNTILKFAGEEFEAILLRARKYQLWLTMANQLPSDLPEPIRRKLGTIQTLILFNLDAENTRLFKHRLKTPTSWWEAIEAPKFHALFKLPHEDPILLRTPPFMPNVNPASCADKVWQNTLSYAPKPDTSAQSSPIRIGDNSSSNSAPVRHDKGNGNSTSQDEPSGGPPPNVPSHGSKKRDS
jgi:hypothetical protein